nr:unnamed protein product [Digitaria exilis]
MLWQVDDFRLPSHCSAAAAAAGTQLVPKFIEDEPPNEWIVDDAEPKAQIEDDGRSTIFSRKRRLVHKTSSSKAKKAWAVQEVEARAVEELEEEEFESSDSEHEEEGNIPYADYSSGHEKDESNAMGDDDE